MNDLPLSFKEHFWDVDFAKLDKNRNSAFIIKRILDRGNTDDINWLISEYDEEQIKNVLKSSRDLSRKTASFWANIFDIDSQEMLCLKKPYSPIHFGLSS